MRHRGVLIGVALMLLGVTPALAEDDPRLSVSASGNYSYGDYGAGKDTTIVYVPFTLGVSPLNRLWLDVTVPFIHQTTQNVIITGGGVASRKEEKGKLARPARSTTEAGLGGVLFKVSYIVLEDIVPEDRGPIPEIAAYGKIKFPTAHEHRRVGTGGVGWTVGAEVRKGLGDGLFG